MKQFSYNPYIRDKDLYMPKAKCHTTHKPLHIGNSIVMGGACGEPLVAQVHIGLDMRTFTQGKNRFPWEPGYSFLFPIEDGCAPRDIEQFKKMINWLCEKVEKGCSIHIGCIGGHGRTGLVLSALVAQYLQITDAIQYVRDNYCVKAVETEEQVEFLQQHYEVCYATPTYKHRRKKIGVEVPKVKDESYLDLTPEVEIINPRGASIWESYSLINYKKCV